MKPQILFSRKNKKNILMCCLLKILCRVLFSVNPKNSFDHILKRISLTVTVSVLIENHHQTVTLTS